MSSSFVSARLPQDTSTRRSLFTGDYLPQVTQVTLTLASEAKGTANLAIFLDKKQVADQRVIAGGSISYAASSPTDGLQFYVNYYDETDFASVTAEIVT